MATASPRKLQKRPSENLKVSTEVKRKVLESSPDKLETSQSDFEESVSCQGSSECSILSKSWVEIVDEEYKLEKDQKTVSQTTSPDVKASSCGPTDFAQLADNQVPMEKCTQRSPFSTGRRRKRRTIDSVVLEKWQSRDSITLNNENTLEVGIVSEESNALREIIYEEGESTLKALEPKPAEEEKPDLKCLVKKLKNNCQTDSSIKRYIPKHYKEPKEGWEWDEAVLERRNRDLKKGYSSDVYKRYRKQVPKRERVRNVHPSTPNRHVKMSRRSWDMQVRIWRRALYVFMGQAFDSDASFISSSASETGSSVASSDMLSDTSEFSQLSDIVTADEHSDKDDTLTLKYESGLQVGPTNFASLLEEEI